MTTHPTDSAPKTDQNEKSRQMDVRLMFVLAFYFAILGVFLIIGVIAVGWGDLNFGSNETRLAIIVALAGGLGALVQCGSSFISYAGERKLYSSWGWWYALRPFIGASLALVFYFAFRGGLMLLSTSQEVLQAENINTFGVGAIGGLVGMFSKEATDKLKEIAESIFKRLERSDPIKPKDEKE
jgi:hypothetical protein